MQLIEITDSAKKQMSLLLVKNPTKWAVSLKIQGGGCAGFKYDWGFYDKKEDVQSDDHLIEWSDGRFVVDAVSVMYLIGTCINWKEEVFGSQFEITNPSAKSGCGCGESFGV